MTVSADFGLLSSSGAQSLQSFYSSSTNRQVLNGISGGFNSSSIFSNSSGLSDTQSASSGFSALTGKVAGKTSSIYSGSGFGSSLIGNYYNSISSVVLGQNAPTSIFEQRLAYSMGQSSVPTTDYPNGNYSNLFASSSSTKSGATANSTTKASSSYDVFSTATKYDYSKISGANTTSQLISSLSVMG